MAFTKIVGAGIHTLSNVHTHNINSSGIITATQFVGPFNGSDGDFSGNVTIDGNLIVNGDTTTLNTTLREVEILRVDANNSTVGAAITQSGSGDILNLYDGSTEVFTVDDEGKVGLGTDAPATNLHINAPVPIIRFTDSDTGQYSDILQSGNSLYLSGDRGASGSGGIIFRTQGTDEKVRITSDGKVGIGTDNPSRELTLYSPDSGSTYINLTNATTGGGNAVGVAVGLGGDEVARIWQYGNTQMEFGTNSTQHMTLASTGQLGIGTDYDTSTTSKKITLGLDSVGDGIWIANKESLYPAASTGYSDLRFTFRDYLTGGFTNGGEAIVRGYNESAYATHRRTALIFMTSSAATSGNATGTATEKFRITSYGSLEQKAYGGNNKLITQRTDAASSNNDIFFQLLAKNTGGVELGSLSFQRESAADDAYFAVKTRNTGGSLGEKLRIKSDGDVIIGSGGVWSYPKPLNVQGSSGLILSLSNFDTTTYAADTFAGIELKLKTGNTGTTDATCEIRGIKENGTNGNSARALTFYTGVSGGSNTEKLRITSDGKLGINYGNPTTIIHAIGNNTVGTSVTMTLQSHDTANATAGIDLLARDNSNNNEICKIQAKSGGQETVDLQFHTNNTEKLRILADGRIRGGSQVAAQPAAATGGFQFDAGGGYFRISKGGGATGTSGAGISLMGGGSNTNHLATASWGSNIYLINTNQVDNNANCIAFANKNSLASSFIIGKNDSHASRNGSLIFATSHGSSPVQRMRITKEGSINIGADSTQSTHMLYMQGTGDVGIHLRADTDNSGENDNPYLSMAQDGGNTQAFKLGMAGDANTAFNMQIANSPFIHANNANSQPLQLAHMSNMVVTLSSVPTLVTTGQSATDPRDFDSNGSLAGNAVGGMKIHHYGNDTAAALMLSGHNNTGTPGVETRTQLTHTGANLRFHIEHHGYEAFNIDPNGNIYLKNVSPIPSFATSNNITALSLRGGGLMNYENTSIYLLNNMHYDGAWRNTHGGNVGGGIWTIQQGTCHHTYHGGQSSANQSLSLTSNISFYKNNSAG